MKMIPAQVVRSSRLVQQSSIIAVYLLSCALYSISTIAWFVLRLQKSSMYCWYIFGLAAAIFWTLLGVTPAELFLVFLPLSVSIAVCLQTICVGPIVNPPAGKICVEGNCIGRLTSIAKGPIQAQYFRKPTLEHSNEDLERNC